MRNYKRSAPPVSVLEKTCLILYVLIVGASITIAPNLVKPSLESLQPWVDWIPAAHRMIEISRIPDKTVVWLASSIVSAPLIAYFAVSRFRDKEDYSWGLNQMKAVLIGLLFMAFLITPWLFVTAYRDDMKRAGAIISAMSSSTPVLVVAGSGISLIYAVVYISLFVVLMKIRSSKDKY